MNIVEKHNIGALVDLVRTTDHSTATAGGTGAGTQVTGNTIDRASVTFGGCMANSGLFGVLYETTLGAADTLSLAWKLETAPDGATWTTYASGTAAVVATGPTGGGTVKGEYNNQVDLTGAYRYIRFDYTPAFSAANTDTFYGDGAAVLGGFDRLAAPNT